MGTTPVPGVFRTHRALRHVRHYVLTKYSKPRNPTCLLHDWVANINTLQELIAYNEVSEHTVIMGNLW